MKLIGVTGGVGSGKSEVLTYLENNYNCRILKSDEVARDLQLPGGTLYRPILKALAEVGGEENLTNEDQTINREEMARRIFGDKKLLEKINGMVHPAVKDFVLKEVEKERALGKITYFFLEAALLIECGYGAIVDEMWYIFCEEEVRITRLAKGRGYTKEKSKAIIESQLTDALFRENSDVVIDNSGEFQNTAEQIRERLIMQTT